MKTMLFCRTHETLPQNLGRDSSGC